MKDQVGWEVLHAALAEAQRHFGPALESALALGSLAHGGFAPEVSDIDLALILREVTPETEPQMQTLKQAVRAAQPSPLAERLSLFWTTWAALHEAARLGRFPLADRLDLLEFGHLLHGLDRREGIARPSRDELVLEAAEFMLKKLATPENTALLRNPADLLRQGNRHAAKAVLFPVRFIYTAETCELAANPQAVQHYAQTRQGDTARLVQAALSWRESGRADQEQALALLRHGLLAVHDDLIVVYMQALPAHSILISGLDRWRGALHAQPLLKA